jgi:hypothetical protein
MTSAATDSDQRTLATAGLMALVFHQIMANASCIAWLPRTSAAISTKRRNASIRITATGPGSGKLLDVGWCSLESSGTSRAATAVMRRNAACQTRMEVRPRAAMTCPEAKEPTMNAADPAARTQPYLKPG